MRTKQQSFYPSRHHALLGMALLLGACSGSGDKDEISLNPFPGVDAMYEAATSPLDDLNLRRKDIPAPLQKVSVYPYMPPQKMECASIRTELAELDLILGPDIAPKEIELAMNSTPSDASEGVLAEIQHLQDMEMPETAVVINKSNNMAQDALVGIIRSKASILPFRSVIRRISGAARHEEALNEAYQSGKLRRAYLKGLAESRFGKRCLRPPKPIDV